MKLEITESALMTEPARVLETMNQLRAQGFASQSTTSAPAIPRSGTCGSCPSRKSRSTVPASWELATDAGSAANFRATIELAGSLRLNVVAEDEATWQSLRGLLHGARLLPQPHIPAGEV